MSVDETNIGGQPSAPAPSPYRENLALIYQEVLTVITRLRTNRQAVADATAFRNSIKAALTAAEAEATRKGYAPEDARLATFAVVAFLDDTIEKANNPRFRDWPRLPLQDELFGEHTSGEIFFQCIDRLLARSDSPRDADTLEIFALCLLLGYRGRYGAAGQETVRAIITSIIEKMRRIRGPRSLAPSWAPFQDAVLPVSPDPWVRPLLLGAGGALVLAVLFFAVFKFALLGAAAALRSISQLTPP
jgi:type VI secretion system protein ImpK